MNYTNAQSIRKARTEDIDIIHHILDMEPFKYNDEVPYDRSWIEQLVTNERCLTLVYESEGQIKGFISGEKMVSGAIMIWFCAVKPDFQNSIIGIKLYNEFERVCRETGVTAILAYGYKTSAGMLDRLDFYSNDTTYREFYKPLVDW
ncbi:MAG TPA: GNAT family N-acetyltransferase [Paludibacter sp.]|nr:GNAT family N-acetyltransferase [Paludibacter sp.]